MKFILNWIVSTLAIVISAYLINLIWPASVTISSVWVALIAALVLGIINALVRPVMVVLTLPITALTLGLFIFVINALMVLLAAWIVPGFGIAGFWMALLFSLVLSIVGGVLHKIA